MLRSDRCAIVVKAQPHRSSNYFETVCCAGVGADGKWRRQYPVPYRILSDDQKFGRWSWIDYQYVTPEKDRRWESQKVIPESIRVTGILKKPDRIRILNSIVRESFEDADTRGESLTLLKPQRLEWKWARKSDQELEHERLSHETLARQTSFLDEPAKPLAPCPFRFIVKWRDMSGRDRQHEADDWESAGAFRKFNRDYGESEALRILCRKYEEEYFSAGLVLAFSTHSRRNVTYNTKNQWLLVGIIRLDETHQRDLFFGR